MGIVMGIFQVSSPLIVIIYLLRGDVWKSFLFTAVHLMRLAIASIRWWIMLIQNVARKQMSSLCAAPGHDTTQSTSRWQGTGRESASLFQDIIEFSDNDDLWMKPQQVKRVKWVHDSAWWCMTTSIQTPTASSTSITTLQVEMFQGTAPLYNCKLQISKWYVYIFHIFLAICLTILQKRGSFHTNILNICKLVYVYPRCRI